MKCLRYNKIVLVEKLADVRNFCLGQKLPQSSPKLADGEMTCIKYLREKSFQGLQSNVHFGEPKVYEAAFII